jgi:hypothetical protein
MSGSALSTHTRRGPSGGRPGLSRACRLGLGLAGQGSSRRRRKGSDAPPWTLGSCSTWRRGVGALLPPAADSRGRPTRARACAARAKMLTARAPLRSPLRSKTPARARVSRTRRAKSTKASSRPASGRNRPRSAGSATRGRGTTHALPPTARTASRRPGPPGCFARKAGVCAPYPAAPVPLPSPVFKQISRRGTGIDRYRCPLNRPSVQADLHAEGSRIDPSSTPLDGPQSLCSSQIRRRDGHLPFWGQE